MAKRKRQGPPARVEDVVRTPTAPTVGSGALVPLRTSHLSADPLREYVAGGPWQMIASYIRALPRYIDDLSRDFGDDIYERMLLDPQVFSSLDVLRLSVLSQGVHVTSAVDDKDADGYEQASEIANFCRRTLDALETPLLGVLYDMLGAVAHGNRVAEQVYAVQQGGVDDGRMVLTHLKVKPRSTYAFVCDVHQNVIGILGLIPGVAFPVLVNSIVSDPEHVPNLLPRSKFAVLSHRVKDGDPRGMSLLRAAYHPWWCKMQTWGDYLRYIAQFASPSLVGYTPEGAQQQQLLDSSGIAVLDASGETVWVSPEASMLSQLQGFRGGSVVALPFGAKVEPIQMSGEGAPFLRAVDQCNTEISWAITGQSLATNEGEHQARAASETHENILDKGIGYLRRMTEEMLVKDIIRPLVVYNWGREALALAPRISLTETQEQDFATDATAMAGIGYQVHPSQYRAIDARLGLPERSDEAVQEELAGREAAREQQSAGGKGNADGGKDDGKQPADE